MTRNNILSTLFLIIGINLVLSGNCYSQTDKLFATTDNTYKISGRQIYISRAEKQPQPLVEAPEERPRKQTIRGVIVDQEGQTVIGAGVIEAGTTNGTVTGLDGEFAIDVAPDAVLRISCIGFAEQEVRKRLSWGMESRTRRQ